MPNRPVPPQDDSLTGLLRLKRHESPGEDYFEDLLPRIHTKLRAEMMRKSSTVLLAERFGAFCDNLAGGRWLAGGVAAYAAALIGGLVVLQWSGVPDEKSPGSFQPVSLEAGAPVQPDQTRVPFQFKVVPVQPLPPVPQAPGTPMPATNAPVSPVPAPAAGQAPSQ